MSEQGLSQHYTYLLVVRDLTHLLVVLTLGNAQVLQQLCSLAFGLPAVHLGKSHLKVGGTYTVFLAHFGFCIQSLTLFHVFPEWLMSHQHSVHH